MLERGSVLSLINNFIQVPTAKFRTWSQRRVSTDGIFYDYLRVRAESVPTFTFYKNGFEHQRAVIDFKETSKPEIVKRSLTRFEPMA